jgi:hypothetical protein
MEDSTEFMRALIELQQAKETQKKFEKVTGEARSKYERVKGMHARARSQHADSAQGQVDAQRNLEQARYRTDDARRKGMSTHRWEAEARRWAAEGQRSADGARRWGEETRRKEREVRTSFEVLRDMTGELADLQKTTFKMEQRLNAIALGEKFGGRGAAPALQRGQKSLAVTEAATAVLKQILADAEGNIRFSFDTARETDSLVSHQGSTVMLIESPLPASLQGTTLDVKETPSGPNLILIR